MFRSVTYTHGMETPIARIARWFVHRNDRPTVCAHCGTSVGLDAGIWRPVERELSCGSDECELQSQSLQSW